MGRRDTQRPARPPEAWAARRGIMEGLKEGLGPELGRRALLGRVRGLQVPRTHRHYAGTEVCQFAKMIGSSQANQAR